MSLRTYHDPLHHSITLDKKKPEENLIINLIESSPFQRLRRIRQLGPASFVFHGAESSRFTHSLGVFQIARRAYEKLVKIEPSLKKKVHILYVSSLLHDLGHGPLSHTSEGIFNINHECWTAKIIKEHPLIKEELENYEKGASDEISNLIKGKETSVKSIKSLVSSQLDCDRLDYLLRDSYSTGTKYGFLDLDRILNALTITSYGEIAIKPKGIIAIEHYLVMRNMMYRSVYNHRINEIANWLLEKIFETAKNIGPDNLWVDHYLKKWMWHKNEIDLETFLAADDNMLYYHLFRWKEGSNLELSRLCKRFLDRDLFKAIDIELLSNENQLKALAIARKLTNKYGLDPNNHCGIRKQLLHGYYPYKGGLRVWDGEKIDALENVSNLVRSLINPEKSTWLIHEKIIHKELKKEIDLF